MDRHVPRGFQFANLTRCSHAIHDRHLQIHEHDVKRARLESRHAFRAVVGDFHAAPKALEKLDGDLLIDEVVFHQEHLADETLLRRRLRQHIAGDHRLRIHLPLPRLAAHDPRDRSQQLANSHRLGEVGGESHCRESGCIALAVEGREHHQACVREFRHADDALTKHGPVHVGHLEIRDHHIERAVRGRGDLHLLQGGGAAADGRHHIAGMLELRAQDTLIGDIVIDDEDAAAGICVAVRRRRHCFHGLERQREKRIGNRRPACC